MGIKTNIHVCRAEKQISQEELAQAIGVRRETVSRLEKGMYNPSLKLAMDIANYFNKTIEDIFYFED